jgi:hypothetical protein
LPEPTMPRYGDHNALRRVVTDLEKAMPDVAVLARMAAEARLRGQPDAGFDAFRKDYLAIELARRPRKRQRG